MELGLDLKITKTRHDMTSIVSNLHFAQDSKGGYVFFFKETDTNFILHAHLKGYKRRNIEIKINEDGSELWVSGEKTVDEMTVMPLKMKKEEEMNMREFTRMFKIPEGVVLDGIKAIYDEDEWKLTIVMPKMAKGFLSRVGIKEPEDPSEVDEKKEEFEEEEEEEEEEALMKKKRQKQRRPCFPLMLGGSAFLLSLILFAIRFIRFKHK
ncbi:uncharacterized protein LOC114720072 [Neltuma alba]|uniref:uncharacterized protein LOC114716385 n=1 Tax=Neltuma alba TaxID=207710 RepID=UPI0010A594DE|nr:uncharacterized protein LOC114716385 [Prosopis alba]XP_028761514.1 uncharacterized protein LOC114720072 [Prosopis alba]